jgi:long-chain acyl-CoA synthetase
VVALETEQGPEPFAVLTCRGTKEQAAAAIEAANARLAEFQRVRRWALWPEPDLPRTSTGKVRRRVVADWLRNEQATATAALKAGETSLVPSDWLLGLISQISGEVPTETNDNSRLSEDLKLDSLGRIQLAAELEHRLGIVAEQGLLDQVETLGQLRKLLAGEAAPSAERSNAAPDASTQAEPSAIRAMAGLAGETTECEGHKRFVYPGWPWSMPLFILRAAFIEAVLRPLVWLLAGPCIAPQDQAATEALTAALPLLIIANHVTAFDMPLIQYALPGRLRRRMAVAMSGEMLEDYRHFRNPERKSNKAGFYLPGPAIYLLITALFNAFPLPRRRDFQLSFAHAGRALDRGFSVLVFPEGTRSTNGELGRFRPGIGLLTRQCGAAVLPVALKGLGELKSGRKQWFRSGAIEVRVGRPLRFTSVDTEMQITARLHQEVEELLKGEVSDSVC